MIVYCENISRILASSIVPWELAKSFCISGFRSMYGNIFQKTVWMLKMKGWNCMFLLILFFCVVNFACYYHVLKPASLRQDVKFLKDAKLSKHGAYINILLFFLWWWNIPLYKYVCAINPTPTPPSSFLILKLTEHGYKPFFKERSVILNIQKMNLTNSNQSIMQKT